MGPDRLAILWKKGSNIRSASAASMRTYVGNVKQLEGSQPPLFRLRVGGWRLIYRKIGDGDIEVVRVRNRREAYRR